MESLLRLPGSCCVALRAVARAVPHHRRVLVPVCVRERASVSLSSTSACFPGSGPARAKSELRPAKYESSHPTSLRPSRPGRPPRRSGRAGAGAKGASRAPRRARRAVAAAGGLVAQAASGTLVQLHAGSSGPHPMVARGEGKG